MDTVDLHIPGMNYCGPYTNLKKRLNPDNTPKPNYMPVDRVDEAAYRHDLFYAANESTSDRLKSDKRMMDELRSITRPTCRERLERRIVIIALTLKSFFTRLICNIDDDDEL